MNKPNFANISRGTTFQILIRGYLQTSWSDRLGGLTITNGAVEPDSPVTILQGALPDQAALLGVLNALYDMRFPLISVNCLDEEIAPRPYQKTG